MLRTLPEHAFRRRARVVAAVFCAVCLGLAVRLFSLQLRSGGWYTDRALGQQLRDTVVPADRGKIYSADGVLLAANSSCWTLRASPREMPDDKLSLAADKLYCRNKSRIIIYVSAFVFGNRTEFCECALCRRLIICVRRQRKSVYGAYCVRDCRFGFRAPVAAHIIKCSHLIFKSPISYESVSCLIVCHTVPAVADNMAEAAVCIAESQKSVKER